jgi:Na+-transporting NADH:ubiquinone oxidoreductase subunit NqrD
VSVPMAATMTTGRTPAAVPGDGPVQSALRAMLTGLGTVWLIIGVVVFVLALLGIGYLFKNRRGGS